MSSDPGNDFATSPASCKEKRLFVIFCYKDETPRSIACVPLNFRGASSTGDRHVLGRYCNNRCTILLERRSERAGTIPEQTARQTTRAVVTERALVLRMIISFSLEQWQHEELVRLTRIRIAHQRTGFGWYFGSFWDFGARGSR